MSRIGLSPIEIPENIEVKFDDHVITVKGPKGELTRNLHEAMTVKIEDHIITVERSNDLKEQRSLHGTTRSLIANMIDGVHDGFEKHLEVVGVGYRVQKQGNKLIVSAGYSHNIEVEEPEGIEIEIPKNTEIIVKGYDKELVGAIASNIRSIRYPEPYKGKGIRYKDETVRRKEGKTAN